MKIIKYKDLEVGDVIHEGDEMYFCKGWYQINPNYNGDKLDKSWSKCRRPVFKIFDKFDTNQEPNWQ